MRMEMPSGVMNLNSPGVMRRVGDNLLGIGRHLDAELHGLAVGFEIGAGFLGNLPVCAAIEVFDHANLDGFLFVVAQFDLKGLVQHAPGHVAAIIRAPALTLDVEGVARVNTNRLIARRMLDIILTSEFQLAVGVLPIES